MKAIVYHSYGTPEVLVMDEVVKPVPKDNEVLIKIHAASINSWDWDLLRGKPFLVRIGGILKPKFKILGADIAGCVEAIGKNIKQLHPGDEVLGDISGCGWGGFAEYVCVPEHVLAIKSTQMTFEAAASVPQAAVLALQALRDLDQIKRGQRVLINGAGGGVGTFAVQIAKSLGAEVTGVDSTNKLDKVRSLGADHVIDFTKVDFASNGQRYDLIVDLVGIRSIFACKRALNPKGIYVMVGGSMSRIFQLMFLGPLITRMTSNKMGLLFHKPNQEDLTKINQLFESSQLVPVIDKCYPLNEAADAFRYYGTGNVQGKIVITVK